MNALLQAWYRIFPSDTSRRFRCKKHGDIGAETLTLGSNGTAPASRVLCHRCFVESINKFAVEEVK